MYTFFEALRKYRQHRDWSILTYTQFPSSKKWSPPPPVFIGPHGSQRGKDAVGRRGKDWKGKTLPPSSTTSKARGPGLLLSFFLVWQVWIVLASPFMINRTTDPAATITYLIAISCILLTSLATTFSRLASGMSLWVVQIKTKTGM